MIRSLGFLLILGWITYGQAQRSVANRQAASRFAGSDNRRPIWNVGHMVNSIPVVDLFLNLGSNSVEFDITFGSDGLATHTFHGVPCDCFRTCTDSEDIVKYIDYVRQLTTPGNPKFREQLVLLFADMKLSRLSDQARYQAGIDIAKKFIDHYWLKGNGTARAYVLLSIPSINHANFLSGFFHELGRQGLNKYKDIIGVDFSGNEDLNQIERVLESMQIDQRIWQGDGITNCLPRSTSRLRECIQKRDRPGKSYIDKVYYWTLDKMSTMRTVLRMGVDGIITNHPDRYVEVLKEGEFSGRFKLATINDNPFQKYKPSTAAYIQGRGGYISDEDIIPDSDELLYNS